MKVCCFCMYVLMVSIWNYSGAQLNVARPSVKVSGEVIKPLNLAADDLAKMNSTRVNLNGRDNITRTYTGVPMQTILDLAGVTTGKELHGENLSKYVLVKCADGYQVVFSLAELDSSFTDRIVTLAYELEGKALPADTGPFRLVVVPGEKKPARNCYQVTEIVVKFAKD